MRRLERQERANQTELWWPSLNVNVKPFRNFNREMTWSDLQLERPHSLLCKKSLQDATKMGERPVKGDDSFFFFFRVLHREVESENIQIQDKFLKLQLSGLGVEQIIVFENKSRILYSMVKKRLKMLKYQKQFSQIVLSSQPHFCSLMDYSQWEFLRIEQKALTLLKLKNQCGEKVLGSSHLVQVLLLIITGDPEQAARTLCSSVSFYLKRVSEKQELENI